MLTARISTASPMRVSRSQHRRPPVTLKTFILLTARRFGVFALARWITRRELRILCYHGAAVAGEQAFRGGLFISPARFRQRLDFLAQAGYPVLELGAAVTQLKAGTLPARATAITIDDGWVGTATEMAPALRDHRYRATLYLATYYVEKQTQVFNVAVDYVLWRAGPRHLDLVEVDASLTGHYDIAQPAARSQASAALIELAATLPDAAARQALLRRVCAAIEIDVEALERSRVISFMTYDEARAVQAAGIDLQLHTHRHHLPIESGAALAVELADNRRALTDVAHGPLVHFCYPSGEYQAQQLPWLAQAGIVTATTTHSGFNYRDTPTLELRRFLDAENITELEFEAEMSGFLELLRRVRHAR